jgi:translation initiation factor 1
MSASDRRLVYSTDPKDKVVDRKEKKQDSGSNARGSAGGNAKGSARDAAGANKSSQVINVEKLEVIFRLEKNGRGGKTVTILSALPKNDQFLSDFTKELKTKCGTGGTYKILDTFGEIEIQGDKREQVKKILTLKGIKFRGM